MLLTKEQIMPERESLNIISTLNAIGKMKIITWNCNMAFRKKAIILTHKPDILIVPECEHPDKLQFAATTPIPTAKLWFGANKNQSHNPELKMIVPISITGNS
jgi:hypothetical protein